MARHDVTHTHSRVEFIMLKAALNKYAEKKKAAIAALRTAGEDRTAAKQEREVRALVGDVGDREGTTLEKLGKEIGRLEDQPDGAGTLTSTAAEAHAYEIGLPLLARRLRTMEGELRSFGRDDWGEWCVNTANHVGSVLLDHYSEQMAHGDGGAEPDVVAAQPELSVS
jgi:hypothetical protein